MAFVVHGVDGSLVSQRSLIAALAADGIS